MMRLNDDFLEHFKRKKNSVENPTLYGHYFA